MTTSKKELLSGVMLLAFALLFFTYAVATLPIGSAFQMGPGYFPVVLSIILAILGLMTLIRSVGQESPASKPVSWRGVILITAASASFGFLMPRLGLVPALLVAVLLSSYSSRRMTVRLVLALTLGLTIFCAIVFRFALGLPVQLFGAG